MHTSLRSYRLREFRHTMARSGRKKKKEEARYTGCVEDSFFLHGLGIDVTHEEGFAHVHIVYVNGNNI